LKWILFLHDNAAPSKVAICTINWQIFTLKYWNTWPTYLIWPLWTTSFRTFPNWGGHFSYRRVVCSTTKRIFLAKVKEVRTTKSKYEYLELRGGNIQSKYIFLNRIACQFLYKAKHLSATLYVCVCVWAHAHWIISDLPSD
jgi:hypothetical protein